MESFAIIFLLTCLLNTNILSFSPLVKNGLGGLGHRYRIMHAFQRGIDDSKSHSQLKLEVWIIFLTDMSSKKYFYLCTHRRLLYLIVSLAQKILTTRSLVLKKIVDEKR